MHGSMSTTASFCCGPGMTATVDGGDARGRGRADGAGRGFPLQPSRRRSSAQASACAIAVHAAHGHGPRTGAGSGTGDSDRHAHALRAEATARSAAVQRGGSARPTARTSRSSRASNEGDPGRRPEANRAQPRGTARSGLASEHDAARYGAADRLREGLEDLRQGRSAGARAGGRRPVHPRAANSSPSWGRRARANPRR
jgi:hypothetical protein